MEGCIYTQDLALLNRLIEAKADVNAYTGDKLCFSHLVSALCSYWWNGAEALVAAKADVNGCSIDGWTVLQETAWTNNVRAVKFLMQNGVNVDVLTDYNNTTALYIASTDRTLDSLRELCRESKALETVCTDRKSTPLCYAVRTHNIAAAALLLDAGAQTAAISTDIVWPDQFTELVQQRRNIKRTLTAFSACARPLIGKDVAKLVLAMVWETRDFSEWKMTATATKKVKN